jgi:hypothetical protein
MHGVKAELNLAEENKEGPVEKPSRNPTGCPCSNLHRTEKGW